MMEILQGYPFSERNDLKVSLTESTELRMMTVVPRALPLVDGGLTVVCMCTRMYVHMCICGYMCTTNKRTEKPEISVS